MRDPSFLTAVRVATMAAKDDPRFKHIAKIVSSQLTTSDLSVTPTMVDKGSNATWVSEFLAAGEGGAEPSDACR